MPSIGWKLFFSNIKEVWRSTCQVWYGRATVNGAQVPFCLSFHLPNLWLLTSKLPQVQDRNWNSNPHIFILVENRTKREIKKSSPATQSCFMEPFKKTHSTTFPSYWPELNHMATPRCKGGWNANICLGTLPHQIKFEFSCWGIRILYSTCQFYHKLLLKH